MNAYDFWASIPHGKEDPPFLLYDSSKPVEYDFNDPDSQYVMFDRSLEGCLTLPFTKEMAPGGGSAAIYGQKVPCTVGKIRLAGMDSWWLGLKIGGYLHEYGKTITVDVSGFKDTDGNEMIPASVCIQAKARTAPEDSWAAHEETALQAARDGIVLLKNENGTLPLKGEKVLNFFGKGLFEFRICAVGAGKILPRYAVGLWEAASEEREFQVNEELTGFYACGEDRVPGEEIMLRARAQSDTAIMVISRSSGENTDNSSREGEFYLTREEEQLLKALQDKFARLAVILNVGYPISLSFVEKYQVDALVYSGYGGMLAGRALMDVLTGRVCPSGKLPDTWSVDYDSIPASRNFYDCVGGKKRIVTDEGDIWLNTVYEEDIYIGYRYFETFPDADRRGYPFGYGLSYTAFSMACTEMQYGNGGLRVVVRIENTGNVPGREVVQLYVSKPQGKLEQPARELIEFEKTKLLAPGECQEIEIHVPESRLVSFDGELAAYIIVPGEYTVYLGGDVRGAETIGSFGQQTLKVVKQVKRRMAPDLSPDLLSQKDPAGTYPKGLQSGIVEGVRSMQPRRKYMETFEHTVLPRTGRSLTFRDVLEEESLLPEFVGNMDVETLARIAVCASDGWGVEGRGEAGRLGRPQGLELPEFIVADGNSGVNVRKRNIGMPSGVTLCASFDKELMERVGLVIGQEAKELGVHLILAPGMNLHRNPLNGRQPEYFSEDPYLAGCMAGWYCKGLESAGVGGCYKHLIANNAESSRKRNQSILSERAIRELYFRAFAYALEVHEPVSVMTSYNGVNGAFTSCDPELIQGVLYEECGFQGFVMTDWKSYDTADVVEMAAAGNAWITPGSEDDTYTKQLVDGGRNGRLPLAQLQDNVMRIIKALVKLND